MAVGDADVVLAEAWRRRGLTDENMIIKAVELDLSPDVVSGNLDDAAGFISAAAFHDLGDLAAVYLEQAGGTRTKPGSSGRRMATSEPADGVVGRRVRCSRSTCSRP